MSSWRPTPSMTGVGVTGPVGLSLYGDTFPEGPATPNAAAASPIPRTASRKYHSRSGFSGLPKFRQFVREGGRGPAAPTGRHASATAAPPPRVHRRLDHRGVAVRRLPDDALHRLQHRGRPHLVVVLADHVFLARDVRGGGGLLEDGGQVAGLRRGVPGGGGSPRARPCRTPSPSRGR